MAVIYVKATSNGATIRAIQLPGVEPSRVNELAEAIELRLDSSSRYIIVNYEDEEE